MGWHSVASILLHIVAIAWPSASSIATALLLPSCSIPCSDSASAGTSRPLAALPGETEDWVRILGAQQSEKLQILATAKVQVNCHSSRTRKGRNHFVYVAISTRLYQMQIRQLAKQGKNRFFSQCSIQS